MRSLGYAVTNQRCRFGKGKLGAGRGIIQNYGALTLEVEILRFGKKPRDKGGRPPKRGQSP